MGCIEMRRKKHNPIQYSRLIETWDVLKFSLSSLTPYQTKINRNMGCIEIFSILLNSLSNKD